MQKTLNSKPFLRIPDLCKDFYVFIDLSSIGVSGYMAQLYNDWFLPTKYLSRNLTSTEARWSILYRECLEICNRFNKLVISWQAFLFLHWPQKPFHISILPSANIPGSRRIYRWSLLLTQFSLTLIYVPSTHKRLGDFLSRQPEIVGWTMVMLAPFRYVPWPQVFI